MTLHQRLLIRGVVQGVGFRPFVHRLANSLKLTGHVGNNIEGVCITVSGDDAVVAAFKARLLTEHPVHARIDNLDVEDIDSPPPPLSTEFKILDTVDKFPDDKPINTEVPPDQAVCEHCLAELFDPTNRRYGYPFINCTDCGPRYSLIQRLPYERHNTSMSIFKMCKECQQEYSHADHSPDTYSQASHRRFHAQANACEACGPTLSLHNHNERINHNDEIDEVARLIKAGKIIAVKGIGGFHLVCDALNSHAVSKLRQRKQRPDKPCALMASNVASLKRYATLESTSITLLQSPAAPIVLVTKAEGCDQILSGIAPNVSDLGCLLPYAPVHYLLFHALLGRPDDNHWLNDENNLALVVTSANLSGEPIITQNEECLTKLAKIADYFLLHDRDIEAPCDDTVMQGGARSSLIRQGRGVSPKTFTIPSPDKQKTAPTVLACGGYFKNTICLTFNNKAYVSPHIGELDSAEGYNRFSDTVEHYLRLFNHKPDAIACDAHPDIHSTRFAEAFALTHNIPLVKVQHHRAHIASVLAEHPTDADIQGPIIGLALDGVGLGDDNTAWGGELFYGHGAHLNHIGQLSPLSLPGGDLASREIWRIAGALLSHDDFNKSQHYHRLLGRHQGKFKTVPLEPFLKHSLHPQTSSAGRWFDAIAAILHIDSSVTFEGQAAMHLEQLASQCDTWPSASQLATVSKDGLLDLHPLLSTLLNTEDKALGAARFHTELIDGLLRWILSASAKYQSRTVVCSGGCFQNKILSNKLKERFDEAGLRSFFPKRVPSNDGGISLGQAWIATQTMP